MSTVDLSIASAEGRWRTEEARTVRLRVMVAVAAAVTAAWVVPSGASLSAIASQTAPRGFQAADYTFVSPNLGWVLGNAPCPRPVCTALLRTDDGGATWATAAPPPIATQYPCARPCGYHAYAGNVRFADPRNGWLFGDVLLATHDGGRTWHTVPGIDAVLDVVAGDGAVMVVHLRTTNGRCSPCEVTADEAPASSDAFRPMRFPTVGAESFESLTRVGDRLWLLAAGDTLFRSEDSGRHWETLSVPCDAELGAWNLRATRGDSIWVLCSAEHSTDDPPSYLLRSADGGRHWAPQLPIPHGPDPPVGAVDLAVSTGISGYVINARDQLISTDDGGRHWHLSLFGGEDVLMVRAQDARHAHALGGSIASGMWRTSDAGRHWSFASFAS